jgi:hypothetical protein
MKKVANDNNTNKCDHDGDSNIAIAREKRVWSTASLQKTNQRLAALSEQHAYRLQDLAE